VKIREECERAIEKAAKVEGSHALYLFPIPGEKKPWCRPCITEIVMEAEPGRVH
jgi:hypothetical protein